MARAAEDAGVRRFTVDEYHRMVDAGILRENDRVELIYGVIREMSPTNRPHTIAATRVYRIFEHGLVRRAGVYVGAPLRFANLDSEPEPDIVVSDDPNVESYGKESFQPLLVIEISDTSLGYDLNLKSELYARAEIPEYWVVDVRHRALVVFRDPVGNAYQFRKTFEPGARVAPLAWPDFEIDVESLFPSGNPSST